MRTLYRRTSMHWLAGALLLGMLHHSTRPGPAPATPAPPDSAAAADSATPPGALAPLAFVVGSCWKGTFPDGRKTDEHCYEWMFDQKFIRDRHVVEGNGEPPYRGETIFAWDAAAKRTGYWYWSSEGFLLTGAVEFREDRIVFPGHLTGPQGEVELEAIWTRRGADAYHVVQRQRTAKGWSELWTMDLTREAKR
jgi:hypothetical protein